ncbi:Hypothetical_protein [Hexamita inflata]|uniref:Hypothetical_protein n=1 Tax=Hexamita inflata TaxID=28002 RepID=A0AA86U2T8_9EUKA|nr:Hypothetical protein HINF_LOCUS25979 [Hexamita inflata]
MKCQKSEKVVQEASNPPPLTGMNLNPTLTGRIQYQDVLSMAAQGQARNSTLQCLITSQLSLQEKLQRYFHRLGSVVQLVMLVEPIGFGLTPSKYWLQLTYRNNNNPMTDQLLIA